MTRRLTRTAAIAAAVLAAAAGCGDNGTDQTASPSSPSPSSAAPSPSASSAAPPSPTASPPPSVDPSAPRAMGKPVTVGDGAAVATVYAYRHNVARTAPRPDEQPGYVWGAADVKVCISKTFTGEASVSNEPWRLVYADDTQIEPSSTGYQQFPEPEYPWGDKAVAPGRCVRGWVTFPVPGKKRPVAVEYGPDGEAVPPRWVVK